MLYKWLRENRIAAGALLLLRLYVGYHWLESGWGKLTGGGFDTAGFLKNAVENPVADRATGLAVYPTYTAFIENFALPNAKLFNFIIPLGEFLVGLGLIVGALTTAAVFFGLLMNFMFLFAGTISVNPWMVLLGVIIIVGGANAGKYGLDYYVLPLLRKWYQRLVHHKNDGESTGLKPSAR
ncbi:DoxX family membrane protein [Paenibacillus sp. KS-LC4]|uniref:DoxX family membrane protein n=1 Tax=Paenibacillus sp. KS-LC4 TaxID=2979727 RepID=UPI0030CF498A